MAVTELAPLHKGGMDWELRYSSDLPGTPTFYIYRDGVLLGTTTSTTYHVVVQPSDSFIFEILDDTSDPSTVQSTRGELIIQASPYAVYYVIEQYIASVWTEVARIQDAGTPTYTWRTPVLADGQTQFRVTAYDSMGNASAAVTMEAFLSTPPDPLTWTGAYDSETGLLTITVS